MYYLYILECGDKTLYTGITTDLDRRFKEHTSGSGSRYALARRPVRIVYSEICASRSEASKREAEVKRWPRSEKLRLITEGKQKSTPVGECSFGK